MSTRQSIALGGRRYARSSGLNVGTPSSEGAAMVKGGNARLFRERRSVVVALAAPLVDHALQLLAVAGVVRLPGRGEGGGGAARPLLRRQGVEDQAHGHDDAFADADGLGGAERAQGLQQPDDALGERRAHPLLV